MSARDELAGIKSRAEKFIHAHDEMIRIGYGVGGLATDRPDLMPDFDAWYHASDVEHADTVLSVIEALMPRTITTAEELDMLPVGSVVLHNGRAFQRYPAPFEEYQKWKCGDGGFVRSTKSGDMILPALVIHEATA